jgi:hypothetical protein
VPIYRYFSADILTGAVLAELPLYGVWMTRQMSTTGEFTGTYKLGTGLHNDTELLEGTIPGKCAIYVERNDQLIWGGIIWSRTWAEEAHTMSMTAQTFESVFDHVCSQQHIIHEDVDQMVILKSVIDQMQSQAGNDFGLDTSGIGTCGVKRTVLLPGYEYRKFQEAVDQVVDVENGIDYTIEILPGPQIDQPRKVVRVGYPNIGGNSPIDDNMMFDYPGNVQNFWWSESSTRGGTVVVGIGFGSGESMLRVEVRATELLNTGWPAWYAVQAHKDIAESNILQATTRADMERLKAPVVNPTFELRSDRPPEFEGWYLLGQNFKVHIESVRFPEGRDTISRMIGWELTAETNDSTENFKFTVEEEEGVS